MIRTVQVNVPEIILALDVGSRQEAENLLKKTGDQLQWVKVCLLYTSPSPRDVEESRMPSSA